MTRAAIYARFSEEDRKNLRGSGIESVAVQQKFARDAIKVQGWTLDEGHVYVDDGISGREILRRTDLQRMLRDAAAGVFDVIVLRDLDRFSRAEPARTLGLLQDLTDVDVKLWEYTSRKFVSMDDTTDALVVAIKATVSASEARKNQPRIIDALRHRDELGLATHRAPFGFKNQRKKLGTGEVGDFSREGTTPLWVRDEDEVQIILRITELFFGLGTYHGVASALNSAGIPGPGGGKWTNRTVHKVLTHPFYRGQVERGATTSVERRGTLLRVAAPADQVRRYAHPEYRIWTPDVEAQIDALVATRTTRRGTPVRRHLASSFVRCCKCGSSIASTGSTRSKFKSYCCDKARARGCEGIGYKAEHKVDAAIIRSLKPQVDDAVLTETLQIVREALSARVQADTRATEHDRIKKDIASAERRLRSLADGVAEAEGGAARAPLLTALDAESKRLDALRGSLTRLEAAPAPSDPKAVLARLERRILGLRETLNLGGIQALPAVAAIMGEDKFVATRFDGEGRVTEWRMVSRISTTYLFDRIGDKGKLQITGTPPPTPASPPAAVAAPAPPAAPAAPAPAAKPPAAATPPSS